jgi:NADH dehydrogenase [ubiquinone] 1 alpha subcomplex assembly factor 5
MAEELDPFPAVWAETVHLTDDRSAARAARRECEIERPAGDRSEDSRDHRSLSLGRAQRTSAGVAELFDMKLRAMRRDRAARTGVEMFLYEHAFVDCLERIELIQRRFERALLIGCPDARWPERLRSLAGDVEVRDPGPLFAERAHGELLVEDAWVPREGANDLVLAVGSLDSINDLPLALRLIRHAMRSDAVLMGALSGGGTLPQLRRAMRSADAVSGLAMPHVHPRVEAAALAPLLQEAGFVRPVVDVDRVTVSYRSLERLVGDLRSMGTTNVLHARPRAVGRAGRSAATRAFVEAGDGSRTLETFEILHFAAFTPAKG